MENHQRPFISLLLVHLVLLVWTLSVKGQQQIYNDDIYANTITITDVSGRGLINYPLQFGRPFIKGHIKNVPGVKFNGTVIEAQVDITNRYEDGSVRFAIVSTILPNIPPNGMALVKLFAATSSSSNNQGCNLDMLLKNIPELDATLFFVSAVNGNEVKVSARDMINQGLYEWKVNGPKRCEIFVGDHSQRRAADFALEGTCKPFRPTFSISYWPEISSAKMRIVLENSNVDCLQDTAYHVTISTGYSTKTQVHSQKDIPHIFGARWTKTYWFGKSQPETKVNIDYNMDYLAMTRYIPNYSRNDRATEDQLAKYYSSFTATKYSNIFDSGKYIQYMSSNDFRDEIGVMPQWCALWLANGDWRMREISIVHAELAGAWRGSFRESNPNLFFDRNHSIPANGKPISINGHPDIWFPDHNGVYPNLGNPVRTFTTPWSLDNANQPDPFSVVYMLTGDFYYYESLYFWACTSVLTMQAGIYGRGLAGWAGINEQVRSIAWIMRSRTFAALYSPDNSPEQKYMNDCIDDGIAHLEGARKLDDPDFRNRTNYIWARQNVAFDMSPLGFFSTNANGRVSVMWQEAFLTISFGVMRDLGYKVDFLLREYSKLFTKQIVAPGYDPRYMAYNWALNQYPDGTWYKTWAEFKQQNDIEQLPSSQIAVQAWDSLNFNSLAVAAASSFLVKYDNGMALFNYTKMTVLDRYLNPGYNERNWRIFPRPDYIPPYKDDPIPPPGPEGPVFAVLVILSCCCCGPIAFMVFGMYSVSLKKVEEYREKKLANVSNESLMKSNREDMDPFQTRNVVYGNEYDCGDLVPPTTVIIGDQIGDSQVEYYKV